MIILTPFSNHFMTLMQGCALLVVIGVPELANLTSTVANPMTDLQRKLFVYILGARFYLALCFPRSRLSRFLERRWQRSTIS